ncbi:ATP-binding protein [Bacillus cytotoxicus]|uniref:ATP-binding protein n=1 Tax=Bacillus cytotoxicus TaxID=580165 RepID=UPI002449AF95|nr:ATP-binding protein [Bacillus cytotoxicus]MDH2879779.1 hypothetical protein [Bacillus cytotoxicus]
MNTLTINITSCSYIDILPLAHQLNDLSNIDHIIFNFNDLDFFTPTGIVFLCSMIENCYRKGKEVTFIYDEMNSKVRGYGEWIGFFEVANIKSGRGARSGDTYLALCKEKVQSFVEESSSLKESVEQRLEKLSNEIVSLLTRNSVIKKNEMAKDNLIYAMREIFRNIFDHSQAVNFWYVGQYYPYDGFVELTIGDDGFVELTIGDDGFVELTIGDDGVGLKETVPFDIEDIWFDRNTHKKAIDLAIQAGVSALSNHAYAPEEYKNSGFGLNMVKKLCEFAEGSFLIATGDSAIHYTKDFNQELDTYYEGTFIRLRLNTHKLTNVSFQKMMDSAIEDAEKAGRSVKPSKASVKLSLSNSI